MNKAFAAISSLLLFTLTAWAGEGTPAAAKPSFAASETVTVTALVEAIDHESREVTLRGPQGNLFSFVVGPEARNLGQVNAGDIVVADYVQSITVDVFAGDGSEPGAGALSLAERTEEGAMPGAAVLDSVVIKATVEEIDLEANTFKLKGPEGNVKQYTARNPENLKLAEVGDIVIITLTEAVALSVEKTTKE